MTTRQDDLREELLAMANEETRRESWSVVCALDVGKSAREARKLARRAKLWSDIAYQLAVCK